MSNALNVEINILGNFGKEISNLINKTTAWSFALNNISMAYSKFKNLLSTPYDDFTQFQEGFSEVISLGIDNVDELKMGILDISKELPMKDAVRDLTSGLYEVISAGVDTSQQLKVTEKAAKAAKAGIATTSDAVSLGSAVTKAYNKEWSEFDTIMDMAFQTVKDGQTKFPELASSMQDVLPTANSMGVSIEELFATYSTLTGVIGNASKVSTGMKAALSNIAKPTNEAKVAAKALGLEFNMAALQTKGWSGFIQDLVEKTNGSPQAINKLFGSIEAYNTMAALAGSQTDTFISKLEGMKNSTGAADEAFKLATDNINSKVQILWNKIEVSFIKAFSKIEPYVTSFADFLIDNFDDFEAAIHNVFVQLGNIVPFFQNLISVLTPLATAVAIFVIQMKLKALWTNRSTIALSAYNGALKLFAFWNTKGVGSLKKLKNGFKSLSTFIKSNAIGLILSFIAYIVTLYQTSENFATGFNQIWEGVKTFFVEIWVQQITILKVAMNAIKGVFMFTFNLVKNFKSTIIDIFKDLWVLIQNALTGNWTGVKAAWDKASKSIGDSFLNTMKDSFGKAFEEWEKLDFSKSKNLFKAGFGNIVSSANEADLKTDIEGESLSNPTLTPDKIGTVTNNPNKDFQIKEVIDLEQLKIDAMAEGFDKRRKMLDKQYRADMEKYKDSEEAKKLVTKKYNREVTELIEQRMQQQIQTVMNSAKDIISGLNLIGNVEKEDREAKAAEDKEDLRIKTENEMAALDQKLQSNQISESNYKISRKRIMDYDAAQNKKIDAESKKRSKAEKSAAITSAVISTYEMAVKVYKALSGIPIVGPYLGSVAAGVATAYGMKQVSNIRKQKFAEGGSIVDGPTLALMGEAGQREFVTPEMTFEKKFNQLTQSLTTYIQSMFEQFSRVTSSVLAQREFASSSSLSNQSNNTTIIVPVIKQHKNESEESFSTRVEKTLDKIVNDTPNSLGQGIVSFDGIINKVLQSV